MSDYLVGGGVMKREKERERQGKRLADDDGRTGNHAGYVV
jgi:hypothetical protein